MNERTITNIMVAYAADAVDVAAESFNMALDYTPVSIEQVEYILSEYESGLPRGVIERMFGRQPSQDHLWQLARMWGAYLGEVLRRQWGGEWLSDSSRGRYSGPDIALVVLNTQLYPPTRVYWRLLNGVEENVWHYYQLLNRDFIRLTAPPRDE